MSQESVVLSEQPSAKSNPLVRRAIALSWFTIAYNLIEGVVSVAFGVSEGSISLAGFGVDSFIEVLSAFVVLWRLRGESGIGSVPALEKERRSTFIIGILFLVLALLTLAASGIQLWGHSHPETTIPGIVISTLSLSFMFWLWRSKKRVAVALDSRTIVADAECSLACIKLSFVLLAGSLIYLLLPSLWWADAVAAVILTFFIAQEGIETVRASRKKDFQGGCGCSH